MIDPVTKIAVPRNVRIYNAARPIGQPRVSPEAVASLAAQVENDSWRAMLLRHPHLAERLQNVAGRRRA